MNKYDVVTIGDAFEDVFVEPDLKVKSDARMTSGKGICFEFGEKIPLNWIQYEIGGSACNVAVGLSRQGQKTGMVSVLGEDTPGARILNKLKKEKVDTANSIKYKDIQTGFSVVFSIDGERTIFSYHAIKDYSKLEIPNDLKSKWFYVSSLGKNTEKIENRIIKELSENFAKLAWNPGPIQIEKGANHFAHLLRCTSVLFLNKEEATKMLGVSTKPNLEDMLRKFHNFGVKITVITDGKNGAWCYDGKNIESIKPDLSTKLIDSTGAGDSFASGFLGALVDADWKECPTDNEVYQALKNGMKNSQSVIKYIGAQKGLLSKEQF